MRMCINRLHAPISTHVCVPLNEYSNTLHIVHFPFTILPDTLCMCMYICLNILYVYEHLAEYLACVCTFH